MLYCNSIPPTLSHVMDLADPVYSLHLPLETAWNRL